MRSWEEARAGRVAAARDALRPLLDGSTRRCCGTRSWRRSSSKRSSICRRVIAQARQALRRALTVAAPLGTATVTFALARPALHGSWCTPGQFLGDAEPIARPLGVLHRGRRRRGTPCSARVSRACWPCCRRFSRSMRSRRARHLHQHREVAHPHDLRQAGRQYRRGAVAAHERGCSRFDTCPTIAGTPVLGGEQTWSALLITVLAACLLVR